MQAWRDFMSGKKYTSHEKKINSRSTGGHRSRASQPGQSVLTESSVRLFGASKLRFGKGREPIGLAKIEKPSSSVSVSSVRCSVSTEVH